MTGMFRSWYDRLPSAMKKAPQKAERAWETQRRKNFAGNGVKMANVCNLAITKQLHAGHFKGENGIQYYPHAATWLNQGRWGDSVVTKKADDSDEAVKREAAMSEDEVEALRERHEVAVSKARESRVDSRAEPHSHLPCDLEKPDRGEIRKNLEAIRKLTRRV
jgi:hypothetical protein